MVTVITARRARQYPAGRGPRGAEAKSACVGQETNAQPRGAPAACSGAAGTQRTHARTYPNALVAEGGGALRRERESRGHGQGRKHLQRRAHARQRQSLPAEAARRLGGRSGGCGHGNGRRRSARRAGTSLSAVRSDMFLLRLRGSRRLHGGSGRLNGDSDNIGAVWQRRRTLSGHGAEQKRSSRSGVVRCVKRSRCADERPATAQPRHTQRRAATQLWERRVHWRCRFAALRPAKSQNRARSAPIGRDGPPDDAWSGAVGTAGSVSYARAQRGRPTP